MRLHSEELTGRGGEGGERFRCFLLRGAAWCLCLDIPHLALPLLASSPFLSTHCQSFVAARAETACPFREAWARVKSVLWRCCALHSPDQRVAYAYTDHVCGISKCGTTGWDQCWGPGQLCASISSTSHQRISSYLTFMNWTAEPFCKTSRCYCPHFAQGSRSRDKWRSCL